MNKFLLNLLVFISIFIVIIILFGCCSIILYKHQVEQLKFNSDISIIICGDSHTEAALNDSIIKGSVNISSSSQHYFYSYNVLNLILRNNSHIKTLILGTSFHSFCDNYDNYLFEYDKTDYMYPRYLPMLEEGSLLFIIVNNAVGVLYSWMKIQEKIVTTLIRNSSSYFDYTFIGSYYKGKENNLNDSTITSAIKRHFYSKGNIQPGFSRHQTIYLNKIAELCNDRNIKMILINTPINYQYYNNVPRKFIRNYYKKIKEINNKILFWDYYSFPLENKYFGDGDHLNYYGAKMFSSKINNLLKEGND